MFDYLFALVDHFLHNTFNTLELGTHAGTGTHGCNCVGQRGRLVGVSHLAIIDCLLALGRAIDFEL
jgi:hypothetical protein